MNILIRSVLLSLSCTSLALADTTIDLVSDLED